MITVIVAATPHHAAVAGAVAAMLLALCAINAAVLLQPFCWEWHAPPALRGVFYIQPVRISHSAWGMHAHAW